MYPDSCVVQSVVIDRRIRVPGYIVTLLIISARSNHVGAVRSGPDMSFGVLLQYGSQTPVQCTSLINCLA